MVNLDVTYLMNIGDDGFKQMVKRTDGVPRGFLIAFMALISYEEKLSATMAFKDDFMYASYYAVGHVLIMLCGAATKAYSYSIRIFDEAQIISGFVLCVQLMRELYTDETINHFLYFSGWFLVVIAFSSIIVVPLYKFRAWLRRNLWDPVLTIIKEYWKVFIAIVVSILFLFGTPSAVYIALKSFNAGNRAEHRMGIMNLSDSYTNGRAPRI